MLCRRTSKFGCWSESRKRVLISVTSTRPVRPTRSLSQAAIHVADLVHHLGRVTGVFRIGMLSDKQVVEEQTQAVDVGRSRDGFPTKLLRARVFRGHNS